MTRIFVGNLSWEMTVQELRELFAAVGTVRDVKIIMDKETGRSRGFGFVEMDSDDEAKLAIAELNGADALGRSITVNEAKPREQGGSGGGRGDGGGYDRNNGERGRRDDRRR